MSRKFHKFKDLEGGSFLTPVLQSFDLGAGHPILHALDLQIFTGDVSGHNGDKNFSEYVIS